MIFVYYEADDWLGVTVRSWRTAIVRAPRGNMPVEIERKFLVSDGAWRSAVIGSRHILQAYLFKNDRISTRIRIEDEQIATLTIKSAVTARVRKEYEYTIPLADARELVEERDGGLIIKRRHLVPAEGLTWEIDVFEGANAGLVIAEIELPTADWAIARRPWLGGEVTSDRRYYNASLSKRPFHTWSSGEHMEHRGRFTMAATG